MTKSIVNSEDTKHSLPSLDAQDPFSGATIVEAVAGMDFQEGGILLQGPVFRGPVVFFRHDQALASFRLMEPDLQFVQMLLGRNRRSDHHKASGDAKCEKSETIYGRNRPGPRLQTRDFSGRYRAFASHVN